MEDIEKEILGIGQPEYVVFRVTSLKSNGSVWTKQFDSIESIGEVITVLLEKFPHVVISRQILKKSPLEHLKEIGERNDSKC